MKKSNLPAGKAGFPFIKEKSEKRSLGIPVIKDRVVQMATKLVIEPIFETNVLESSYGYRPGRSAHQAIGVIRCKIMFERQTKVIDADIKGYLIIFAMIS